MLGAVFLFTVMDAIAKQLTREVGLAEATAIMEINPVLITLGAFLFLGENICPIRVVGITASIIGALIIIRPGTDVFKKAVPKEVLLNLCYIQYFE